VTPHLADVRVSLARLLGGGLAGVDSVYDHEPDIETTGPCWVTIWLEQVTFTDQVWVVRIYSQILDSPDDAFSRMLTALEAVDDRLKTASAFGPSQWSIGLQHDLGCIVSRISLNRGRESF